MKFTTGHKETQFVLSEWSLSAQIVQQNTVPQKIHRLGFDLIDLKYCLNSEFIDCLSKTNYAENSNPIYSSFAKSLGTI